MARGVRIALKGVGIALQGVVIALLVGHAPSGSAAEAAASGAVSPLVAASRAARAARDAKAVAQPRKVWTLEDLEALGGTSRADLNFVALPTPGVITVMGSSVTAAEDRPKGVAERYRELLAEANAEIGKLERERLSVSNPLLKGMAGDKPRPAGAVDADLAKWRERRDVAEKYSGGN